MTFLCLGYQSQVISLLSDISPSNLSGNVLQMSMVLTGKSSLQHTKVTACHLATSDALWEPGPMAPRGSRAGQQLYWLTSNPFSR